MAHKNSLTAGTSSWRWRADHRCCAEELGPVFRSHVVLHLNTWTHSRCGLHWADGEV